jgi:hypothetical protein
VFNCRQQQDFDIPRISTAPQFGHGFNAAQRQIRFIAVSSFRLCSVAYFEKRRGCSKLNTSANSVGMFRLARWNELWEIFHCQVKNELFWFYVSQFWYDARVITENLYVGDVRSACHVWVCEQICVGGGVKK